MVNDQEGSFYPLFSGNIMGKVLNRVTGNTYSRKDAMGHYKYLIKRSLEDPTDVRIRRMMRFVANMLDIPSDIHEKLIEEAWKDRSKLENTICRPFIKADIETMYTILTGDTYIDNTPVEGISPPLKNNVINEKILLVKSILDDYDGVFDKAEVETYSTFSEMVDEDISLGTGTSLLDTTRDSPFTSDGWGRKYEGSRVGNYGYIKDVKN